jgi:non-ribosomal peptide synthetase component F
LVANRQQPHSENLIGYFVNAVVLRTRVATPMSFDDLLRRTQSVAQQAFAHQDLPIADLTRALQREGCAERAEVYQVMVNYRRLIDEPEDAAGLTFAHWSKSADRAAEPDVALTPAELSFEFRERATKLTVAVNYRCSLFDALQAQRLFDGFMALLAAAMERPEQGVTDFNIMARRFVGRMQ